MRKKFALKMEAELIDVEETMLITSLTRPFENEFVNMLKGAEENGLKSAFD